MHKKESNIKATIKHIIVAFIFVAIICIIIQIMFGNQISMAISLVNKISIDTSKKVLSEIKLDENTNKLKVYPEYGTKYGNIEIDSINVNLPLYYGDTLKILRNGVGHSSGSYFPGEGGSIVCMAHNTTGFLKDLSKVKKGDKIKITTSYGEFIYQIYDTKVVDQTNLAAVPIQKEEEKLMLYTCYPTNTMGHAKQRFITYSQLVKE